MRKKLSSMTTQQFVEATAALGLNYKQLAEKLGVHQTTVSNYVNGKTKVPQSVLAALEEAVQERKQQIERAGYMIQGVSLEDMVPQMIVFTNQNKSTDAGRLHATEGRLMRRQSITSTDTYPLYRLDRSELELYVLALKTWRDRVVELAQMYTDDQRQRDYKLELADIKQLASIAPRQAPYDICLQHSEWGTVSRALTYLHKSIMKTPVGMEQLLKARKAISLRLHWYKHLGSGYPPNRKTGETT